MHQYADCNHAKPSSGSGGRRQLYSSHNDSANHKQYNKIRHPLGEFCSQIGWVGNQLLE